MSKRIDGVGFNDDWIEQWDEEGRFYEPGENRVLMGGREYHTSVEEFDLNPLMGADMSFIGEDDQGRFVEHIFGHDFPTTKRVITEVCVDPKKPHDVVVCVFPGWGETTAQFDQDFLETQLMVLKDKGYLNPKVLGVNCSGKGTKDYMKNEKSIVKTGVDDEIADAKMIARYLSAKGQLGNNIYVVGHSMGGLTAEAFAGEVERIDDTERVRGEVSGRISGVMQLMPSTDQPYGNLRGGFIGSTISNAPVAMKQLITGEGGMSLSDKDTARIMFSGKPTKETEAYRRRSVPDSAAKFVGAALNTKRRIDGEWLNGKSLTIGRGVEDRLVPKSMVVDAVIRGEDLGAHVQNVALPFAHSLPLKIRGDQRCALEQFFLMGIKEAGAKK